MKESNRSNILGQLPERSNFLGQLPEMKTFTMDWRDNEAAVVDVSFLLEAPAGKHGFVKVQDGHLVSGGKRFRIWGINMADSAAFPPKSEAPAIAAHLARFGVNCVRFHHMDRLAPNGMLVSNRNDTRALDEKMIDRLDFFICELKKRGIYSDLNLNVSRAYKPGDGVRDNELIGAGKALTYFNDRLIELQREYAKQVLTHYNPYTQSEYRNEPAVLIVEMVNENSIVEYWITNRLQGKHTGTNPSSFSDIPPSYEKELTERYNVWLIKRLSETELKEMRDLAGVSAEALVPRLQTDEFEKAPAKRFRTEAAFYMELEETFFKSMATYLRDELAVKSLLIGTSSNNSTISTYPLLHSLAQLDIVDGHEYWTLPELESGYAGGRHGFELPNTPEVNNLHKSAVVALSRSAIAGIPFVSTETGHMFPSEYASEAIPIFAAYAAFQDWDGIFWYTFDQTATSEWKSEQRAFYEMRAEPVKMTQLAAGALTFLGHHVRSASQTIFRSYSIDQVYESARLPQEEKPYFTPSFPLYMPLQHAVRISTLDGDETAYFENIPLPSSKGSVVDAVDFQGTFSENALRKNKLFQKNVIHSDPVVSDTKELAWYQTGGAVVTIDTPQMQGIVGYCSANNRKLSHLFANVATEFCAITLNSLDGLPLSQSTKMLLETGARVANTGMRYNDSRKSLIDWGTAPTVIEPVTGTIILVALEEAIEVKAIALDGGGCAIGEPIIASRNGEDWWIPVGNPATPWYLIEVKR